jgi:hypothetical protein
LQRIPSSLALAFPLSLFASSGSELSLETTYPLPEATVLIMLTNSNNLGCIIFLGIPSTW